MHSEDTFSVDFTKVLLEKSVYFHPTIELMTLRWVILIIFSFQKIEGAVESLSREILTIQAQGDKQAAGLLLQKYSVMTEPLKAALKKLENIQV